MIIHEEFEIKLHAPMGGECHFCDQQGEHALYITNDNGEKRMWDDLCGPHATYIVLRLLTRGFESLKEMKL